MLAIIGQVIRQLREENGISLEELSARAGISVDKLDKIEKNETNPSLGVLIRISRALGAKLGALLAGKDEDRSAVVTRRKDLAGNLTFAGNEDGYNGHLHFYAMAQDKADRHMEPLVVEIAPSGGAPVPDPRSEHSGEEFVYVLEGEATLYYGEETYRLEAGDSVYYDSVVPHFLANESDRPARVLAVLYTPY
ncbi:helix-turn-helix domain-containing protein [Rikenella microfusus]|uniref:helix-turn-helix domain-containing protein n=1 Tax=Rikenella microfusus TaxID=28139 RepID=UPI001D4ACA79|nr:cupin domain-containing protein [Rikenella microfusus]HJE88550.1 cupin domain-containing protein [Rikenella microfusus]